MSKRSTKKAEVDVRPEAESNLLDQVDFDLDEEAFEDFAALLDAPPKPDPRLARLLNTKSPWEK